MLPLIQTIEFYNEISICIFSFKENWVKPNAVSNTSER